MKSRITDAIATSAALCALVLIFAVPAGVAAVPQTERANGPEGLTVGNARPPSQLGQTRTIRQAHALWRQASGHALWPGASLIGPNGSLGTTAAAFDGSLEYHSGDVQHNPTFYAIFWLPSGSHYEPGIIDGDFGNTSTGYLGYAGLMDRYLKDAGSTGEARVASQYYDTKSGFAKSVGTSYSFGGDWHDTTAYTHSGTAGDPLMDADIQGAVNRALAANPSWKDGVNSTFFVFTALGIESCFNATNGCTRNVTPPAGWATTGYCAYHGSFTDANSKTAVYANMPEAQTWGPQTFGEGCHGTNALPNGDIYADNEFSTLSHELFESATNPTNGGWRDNTSDLEIGDPCADSFGYSPYFGPSNTNVNGHLYNVQEEANNESGGCSEGVSQPGDGSYYLLYSPYTATAGSSTGNINLAQTVLAPNRNCCGTDNPSVNWGDGTSSEPGGDTGCIICNLTGSHTYAFDSAASYPKTYTVTVTYWTGLHFCGCFLDSDTRRSISLHIIVFKPTTDTLRIAADDQTMSYGGPVPTFTASFSGFINGDTSSVITGLTCGATDGQGHPVSNTTPVGTYTITCSNATAPSYYVITYATGTLTVNQAPLTITADNRTKMYGAQLPALTWTGTGWVNGQGPGTLTTQPTCTTTATAQSHVSGNPYSITCSGAAADNYAIGYVNGTLTVTTAPVTITADNKSMTYGGIQPALTATYGGLVNGDTPATFNASPNVAPTLSTVAATSHAGSYAITVTGAVDPDYAITPVNGTLTIGPAPLTITADDQTMTYGGQVPTLTWHANFVNGDSNGTLSQSPNTAPTCTAAHTTDHVAVYVGAITCSGAADTDYTIGYAPGTLTITKAPLTVTADPQSRQYGSANPPLTATLTGFVLGQSLATSGVTGTAACSTTATSSSPVAGYPITCTQGDLASADYSFGPFGPGTLTVTKAPLTVTADVQSRLFGSANPPLTATLAGFVLGQSLATSGVTGSASCTTTATTYSPGGGYPITCTNGSLSSANYSFGPFVPGTLTVTFSSACVTGTSTKLTVSSGQAICVAAGAHINGQVTVAAGGSLDVEGATITGPITATGGAVLRACGTTLSGPLTVTASTGLVLVGGDPATGPCASNSISGPVRLTGNFGGVECNGNTVIGPLTITGNTGTLPPPDPGSVRAVGNTVSGKSTIQS